MDALPNLLSVSLDYDPSQTELLTPVQLALIPFHPRALQIHLIFAQAEFMRRRDALLTNHKQEIVSLRFLIQALVALRAARASAPPSETVKELIFGRRKDVKAEEISDWEGYIRPAVERGVIEVLPTVLETVRRRKAWSGPRLKLIASFSAGAELEDPLPLGLPPDHIPLCWPLARYLAPFPALDLGKISHARLAAVAFLSVNAPPLHALCSEWKTRQSRHIRPLPPSSPAARSPTSIYPNTLPPPTVQNADAPQELPALNPRVLGPLAVPPPLPAQASPSSTSATPSAPLNQGLDDQNPLTDDSALVPTSVTYFLITLRTVLPITSHAAIMPCFGAFIAALSPPPLRPIGISVLVPPAASRSITVYFAFAGFDSAAGAMSVLKSCAEVHRVDSEQVGWRWNQMLNGTKWLREAWMEDVCNRAAEEQSSTELGGQLEMESAKE